MSVLGVSFLLTSLSPVNWLKCPRMTDPKSHWILGWTSIPAKVLILILWSDSMLWMSKQLLHSRWWRVCTRVPRIGLMQQGSVGYIQSVCQKMNISMKMTTEQKRKGMKVQMHINCAVCTHGQQRLTLYTRLTRILRKATYQIGLTCTLLQHSRLDIQNNSGSHSVLRPFLHATRGNQRIQCCCGRVFP